MPVDDRKLQPWLAKIQDSEIDDSDIPLAKNGYGQYLLGLIK